MAAFTTFSEEALARYLVMFGLGQLSALEAIEEGIENSNYFVTMTRDGAETTYVLTIIEQLSFEEVPFFNKVLTQLFYHGLPVAAPKQTLDGMTSTIFCGKPTFLFPKLPGRHLERVTDKHCFALGRFMAISHRALDPLSETRDNPYDTHWMKTTLGTLNQETLSDELDQLRDYLAEYETLSRLDLPTGLIHGDLFTDNALFEDDTLTGVIDFYHACEDFLIQDLAIAINDWCADGDQEIDPGLRSAMLAGYESERELSAGEQDALVPLQRVSAARFALTRFLSGDPPLKNPMDMLELARKLT